MTRPLDATELVLLRGRLDVIYMEGVTFREMFGMLKERTKSSDVSTEFLTKFLAGTPVSIERLREAGVAGPSYMDYGGSRKEKQPFKLSMIEAEADVRPSR